MVASHNGDPSCHTPNLAAWHNSYYGLARGIVQVTLDAATPQLHRQRLHEIDVDGGIRTQIASDFNLASPSSRGLATPTSITVTASSPGLASATLDIPLSTDQETHSVLASARRSLVDDATVRWQQ